MNENKTMNNSSFNIGFGLKLLVLYTILGYFVYDNSVEGAIAVLCASIVIGIVMLLSLVPIFGWIAAILINYFYVIPKILLLTGITWTWLITLIFVVDIVIGLILTGIILVALIAIIFK